MEHRYIAAIDQGTTSSRVILYKAESLGAVTTHQEEYQNSAPQNGWLEVDPNILIETVVECINRASEKLVDIDPLATLDGIGITNQRETLVVWDRETGAPLHPAIIWADARTAPTVESIATELTVAPPASAINSGFVGAHATVPSTGLPVSTYFTGCKIRWLVDNVPRVAKALDGDSPTALLGTVDSWLVWRLSGGGPPLRLGPVALPPTPATASPSIAAAATTAAAMHASTARGGGAHVTDVSNASRTLLLPLAPTTPFNSPSATTNTVPTWDRALCSLFRAPVSALPHVVPSAGSIAIVSSTAFSGAVISGIAGDQQAALVGHGALWNPTSTRKATFGTGLFALATAPPPPPGLQSSAAPAPSTSGLLTTVAYAVAGPCAAVADGGCPVTAAWNGASTVYAREGAVAVAGSGVRWLVDAMGCASSPKEVSALAATVSNSGGVVFVPAFSGLLAPHWRPDARGALVGLSTSTTRAHICRAMLDAVAFQCAEVLAAMAIDDAGTAPSAHVSTDTTDKSCATVPPTTSAIRALAASASTPGGTKSGSVGAVADVSPPTVKEYVAPIANVSTDDLSSSRQGVIERTSLCAEDRCGTTCVGVSAHRVDLTMGDRKGGVDEGKLSHQLTQWLALPMSPLIDGHPAKPSFAVPNDGDPTAVLEELRVDGGMCSSDTFLQILSNTTGRAVVRSENYEVTALGAAMLAGLGGGTYASAQAVRDAIAKADVGSVVFLPSGDSDERVRSVSHGVLVCPHTGVLDWLCPPGGTAPSPQVTNFKTWYKAVDRSLGWHRE